MRVGEDNRDTTIVTRALPVDTKSLLDALKPERPTDAEEAIRHDRVFAPRRENELLTHLTTAVRSVGQTRDNYFVNALLDELGNGKLDPHYTPNGEKFPALITTLGLLQRVAWMGGVGDGSCSGKRQYC